MALPKINPILAKSPIEYQNNISSGGRGGKTYGAKIPILVKLSFKQVNETSKGVYETKGDSIVFYYVDGDLNISIESQVFITNDGIEGTYKVHSVSKPIDPYTGLVHHTKVVLK